MDDFLWLIGFYILYSLFAKLRNKKPSAGDPPTFPPGLDRPRRSGSRDFPYPSAGMPASRPDSPVRPKSAEGTPGYPNQFPWPFPEVFGEVLSPSPKEPDWDADAAVRWKPVEPVPGLTEPAGLTPNLPQASAAVTQPEAGLALTSGGAMFKVTPAAVAGGIIWSEILQPPRSRRPYQWRRKSAGPLGRK